MSKPSFQFGTSDRTVAMTTAFNTPSGFQAIADAATQGFEATKAQRLAEVFAGRITPSVARESLVNEAVKAKIGLRVAAEKFTSTPPHIAERITRAVDKRTAEAKPDTADLLRELLVETRATASTSALDERLQSLADRRGAGLIARTQPNASDMVELYEAAKLAGDEAAKLALRRRMETYSNRPALNSAEADAIQDALWEPSDLSRRQVDRYAGELTQIDPARYAEIARDAIDTKNASLLFALVQHADATFAGPDSLRADHWSMPVLAALGDGKFPSNAVDALTAYYTERLRNDRRGALIHAEAVAANIGHQARLDGVAAPTEREITARAATIQPTFAGGLVGVR